MASPLNGRLKRLETERGSEYAHAYLLGPEGELTTEEWLELYAESEERDTICKLKPLQRRSYIRGYETRVRKVPLGAAIDQARQQPALGRSVTEIWGCSSVGVVHIG